MTVQRCINEAGAEPDVFSKVCKLTADLPPALLSELADLSLI